MKNILRIAIVGLCVLTFGAVAGTDAMADINIAGFGNSHIQAPLFEVADSPSGKTLQFNVTQGVDQSSLGTCTMNPMSSNAVDAIIDELPVREPEVYIAVRDYGYDMSTPTTPPNTPYNRRPSYPPPDDPDTPTTPDTPTPPTNVPEPATMLIFALGIAGAAPFARRFRGKRS